MSRKIGLAILSCVLLINTIGLLQSSAQTKEEILWLITEFDNSFRDHDTDRNVSLFSDDAIIDMVVMPPFGKEGQRQFLDEMWPIYPTIRDHPDAFALASVSDKVGIIEHSTVYVWPDTGYPVSWFHLCVKDCVLTPEGPKIKQLTAYGDWAAEPIQGGAMPRRNLGDMVPSFTLPASEGTGLSAMKASAELMSRLNSRDLPNVAKMIREDADVRFPFIDRPATRSELMDIYEQILGGFSDAYWENTRRVDMGDGWVFSEATLKGTNDGELLGKVATGLSMNVRSGLVEHFDENGLADYVHFHFDTLSMPGQAMPTDEAKEEILAIMEAMNEAYGALDADLIVSYYAEDAIVDCPPFEPWGKEEDREFLREFYAIYPTFSLATALSLASGSEKVGILEHSQLYVVNGSPIDALHICAHDFEGGKMKRLTVYMDYAIEQIQSGAMPQRNLGDMIPSFPLPAPAGTGLNPMEASAEFLERLNSHDLSNVAKMIQTDVDVWFPFIGRTSNRRELIDIHEQMLGGFSDMSWENVRRVDMGDGWVFSEVKLRGTNDGEFLGKPATGLPMEVRSGLIEHYDENGLADYVHFHFDTLSVPGQEAPTGPVEDFSNVFFTELKPGLNMVSLPLKPQNAYTARSLAEEIGATVVIKYDEAQGRFVGYISGSPGDGFPIEGGKGYIVNCLEGKTHAFTGTAWTNEPSAEAAPPAGSNSSGWAFIVSVAMTDHKGDDYTVTVRNLRTGAVAIDSIADSRFHAVFADLNRNTVIEAGDRVEIVIRDSSSKIVAGPVTYQIGQEDIRSAFRDILIPYGYARPEKSVLLQNYPNPFNPETWIPFHLAQDADVSVRIYDASGRLIRSLALGHKEAGIYVERDRAVYWNGKSDSGEEVASGIYFYTITAGDFSAVRKMIVKR